MNKIIPSLAVLFALVSVDASAATSPLAAYVEECRKEGTGVGFTESIPNMDCREATVFDTGVDPANPRNPIDAINDAVGYYKVNRNVDLTFACRWMREDGSFRSLEMLLHNRATGATCFFGAKPNQRTPTVVSITDPSASAFWDDPQTVNSHGACVNCHAAKVYIASRLIAPVLGKFGLLNGGHDLLFSRYHVVVDPGGAFSGWQQIARDAVVTDSCSSGCHALASNSTIAANVRFPNNGFSRPFGGPLARPIKFVIQDVINHGLMPDGTGVRKLHDDYRWMSVDTPDDANTTGDVELFYALKGNTVGFTPELNSALTCETEPASMEAHAIAGFNYEQLVRPHISRLAVSNHFYLDYYLPDDIEKFDHTGLVCRNQPSNGMCENYVVRFNCLPDRLSVFSVWTGRALTIANPDANQVRWAKGQPYNSGWGPLSQTWHIEAVNDGSTHYNYVRFRNDWLGVRLNADGPTKLVSTAGLRDWWLSEQWVMEYVAGTRFVRFRNLWQTDLYLTMAENNDYSPVNLQPLHRDSSGNPDWLAQQWELRPAAP